MSRLGRRDVVVAGQDHRLPGALERGRVLDQPIEPGQLVVEFRAGLRIAVGQIDRGDEDAADGRFDVAALPVARIARQLHAGQDRLGIARQDGDTVPGALAAMHGEVAGALDRGRGKRLVRGLQFLQAHDIRLGCLQPLQQEGKAPLDVIDVEGGDFHGPLFLGQGNPPGVPKRLPVSDGAQRWGADQAIAGPAVECDLRHQGRARSSDAHGRDAPAAARQRDWSRPLPRAGAAPAMWSPSRPDRSSLRRYR